MSGPTVGSRSRTAICPLYIQLAATSPAWSTRSAASRISRCCRVISGVVATAGSWDLDGSVYAEEALDVTVANDLEPAVTARLLRVMRINEMWFDCLDAQRLDMFSFRLEALTEMAQISAKIALSRFLWPVSVTRGPNFILSALWRVTDELIEIERFTSLPQNNLCFHIDVVSSKCLLRMSIWW